MALASTLSDIERKELNRELGLPIKDISKPLKYFKHIDDNWNESIVKDYEIIDTLEPSGSKILRIVLENDASLNIHADYFAEMQKPSFISSPRTENMIYEVEPLGDSMPKSYVVVDIETTGINHNNDKIIEIGAIRYDKGKESDRLSLLVDSGRDIPDGVSNLTGITNEMLSNDGIKPIDAAKMLKEFISGSIIVGHNFDGFDKYFINDLFKEFLNVSFCNNTIDTLKMSKNKYPILSGHKLKDLAEMYRIDYSKAHRAVEDCQINHYVYEFLAFDKLLCDKLPALEVGIGTTNDSEFEDNEGIEVETTDDLDNAENILVALDDADIVGWKKELNDAMKSVIEKHHLPENSLVLRGNLGRTKKTITSYSICIYESDLIEDTNDMARNTAVVRIAKNSENSNILKIEPKKSSLFETVNIPVDAEVRKPKTSLPYMKIDGESKNLVPFLLDCIEDALDNYKSKESNFACCARYKQCSVECHCIHPNKLFSKACAYRTNLEQGKNFLA